MLYTIATTIAVVMMPVAVLNGGYNDDDVCAQVEEYLAKVVQLFSYLTDKDLFAEIYRNQLARRLLNSRSASDDMERLMIGGFFIWLCAMYSFLPLVVLLRVAMAPLLCRLHPSHSSSISFCVLRCVDYRAFLFLTRSLFLFYRPLPCLSPPPQES